MRTSILLSILFCFSLQSCFLTQNTTQSNRLEVLDLKQYKDWELQEESDSKYYSYKLNSKRVRVFLYDYEIHLSKRDSSPFNLAEKYFPDTKVLFYKAEFFRNEPIGTSYSYDREGNLVEEINHDEHFSFSIYDLIDKIKKEYKVDLMISKDFRGVRRFYMNELDRSFYIVFLQGNPLYIVERILIDGNTGEILYQDYYKEDHYYGDRRFPKGIEDIYLERLQKEKAKE